MRIFDLSSVNAEKKKEKKMDVFDVRRGKEEGEEKKEESGGKMK